MNGWKNALKGAIKDGLSSTGLLKIELPFSIYFQIKTEVFLPEILFHLGFFILETIIHV